jgi:uncharacterized protein
VVIYLDTSALLKLVWVEDQSRALRAFLDAQGNEPSVSSRILTIETRRAVRRAAPDLMPRADLLLTQVGQVGLSHAVVESASRLPDLALRSLHAIHVATALVLGEEVSAFATYDKSLFTAAQALRLPVVAPS